MDCFFDKREIEIPSNGKRIGTSLMGYEGEAFVWNLAFCFMIAHREAAFKVLIRSFITFHGIFMASGCERGEDSGLIVNGEKVKNRKKRVIL